MKTVKLKLGDDKIYTFSSLSIRQRMSLKEVYNSAMALQDEANKAQYEVNEDGELKKDSEDLFIPKEMKDKDRDVLFELENKLVDVLFDIFRMSLCRKHSEFKIKDDLVEDKKLKEQILQIVDMDDIKDISQFAMSGVIPYREANDYDFSDLKTKTSFGLIGELDGEPEKSE